MKRSAGEDVKNGTDATEDGTDEKGKRQKKKEVKAGAGFDTRWRFKVMPQPPKFPFKDEFFELNVFLVDQEGVLKANYEVPISLDLFVEGESVPVCNTNIQGNTSIEIDPSTPAIIGKEGSVKIRVKVCELSMNRNNRKFCFVVKRKAGPRGDLPREINPVMTRAMLVVNSHIKITNELPEVFYKDQGGRDKCLEINLELHGPHGIVTGQEVPVRCALLYEDYQPVINQDILQPSPTTNMVINKTGISQIRVRIEDVSKNHQSKNFRIKVEPDTSKSPIHFDKSPDISTPILVRSKLNSRQKRRLAMQSEDTLKGEEAIAVANLKAQQQKAAQAAAAQAVVASQGKNIMMDLPNSEPSPTPPAAPVEDLSRFPPEVATALWCQSARNTMASLSALLSGFVQSYDRQVAPHVRSLLEQQSKFDPLCSQVLRAGESISSMNGDNNGGPVDSLLPSESTASTSTNLNLSSTAGPLAVDLGRSISCASQGMAHLMRGSTVFFRSLSNGLQGDGLGYGGPGDFSREMSLFSVPGFQQDDGFNNAGAKMGNVPRLHSLAPQDEFSGPESLQRYMSGSTAVVYILRWFHVWNDRGKQIRGLPAFDQQKRLVGFYFFDSSGVPTFKDTRNAFSKEQNVRDHIDRCESAFKQFLETDPSAVHTVRGKEDGYAEAIRFFQRHQI